MTYIADYSDKEETIVHALTQKLAEHPFSPEKAKAFCQMTQYMEAVAKNFKGYLEIELQEERFLGRIVLKCDGYYMFWGEDDIPRTALSFALQHMTSVFFDCREGKLVIDMVENLA